MKWTLVGNSKQRPDCRKYHCPECLKSRKECDCPKWKYSILDMAKPDWTPY